MALVRCSKHSIPYNDANPRGCPACWQEQEGRGEAELMRELARASRGVPHVEILEPDTSEIHDPITAADWPPPVTTPPRLPTRPLTRAERLVLFLSTHRTVVAGAGALAVIALLLLYIARPTFTLGNDPPLLREEARPFPVQLGMVIDGVFALFGTVPPRVNPDSPSLARYQFEPGVIVDALNSTVYAVTLTTIDRAWNGNRVGLPERQARGRLALLGPIQEPDDVTPAPFPVGSYLVYAEAAVRPRRRLVAEIRPPNGCYDVQVDIAPRIIGTVTRGDESFVVVARRGRQMEWVAVMVRAVSRTMEGPYAGAPACENP